MQFTLPYRQHVWHGVVSSLLVLFDVDGGVQVVPVTMRGVRHNDIQARGRNNQSRDDGKDTQLYELRSKSCSTAIIQYSNHTVQQPYGTATIQYSNHTVQQSYSTATIQYN